MLDVANGEDKDGANIGIYHAYSGDAQKFVVQKTSNNENPQKTYSKNFCGFLQQPI